VRRFWETLVAPVLDATEPSAIVEIGAGTGKNTALLAAWAREHGATLHIVDPAPEFDLEAITREGRVVVHTDLSLNVLPHLPPVDVALIDGDHNWYTVVSEILLLQQAAREHERPTPVMLCHDVGWPCGRRDHYYDPAAIPEPFRQPWLHVGFEDGRKPPAPKDVNSLTLCCATEQGGPRNGVLTAIEDFLIGAGEPISLSVLRREHGAGVLVPETRSKLHPELDAAVARARAGATPRRRSGEQLIPRVIHRLWLGPDPISPIFERFAASWREHHPDWELCLWRDELLPPLSCRREYEAAGDWDIGPGEAPSPYLRALETWRVRYDIVRLELLRQFGGVIVDMDMEAIRPLDPLLPDVTAFAGRATHRQRVGNQVLGAVPGHPFFQFAVRQLRASIRETHTSGQRAGNGFLSRMLARRPQSLTVFPRDTFHSPLTIEPPRRPDDFPHIYAVHHHLESYRADEPGQDGRHERRLHEAQIEIDRLEDSRRQILELKAKERRGRQQAEARLENAIAKIERLAEKNAELRARLKRTAEVQPDR
jgi:methyltransferase family protein/glycosyl transferase-like sugar-binding protein